MFTQEEINELLKNEYVSKCSSKSITYSKEFKELAVKRYLLEGYSPSEIFREAGFNLNVLGKDRPKNCLRLWRKTYQGKGVDALKEERRGKSKNGGRKKKMVFKSKDEEIEYLKAKIAYMDAENDFLAKLRGLKRK